MSFKPHIAGERVPAPADESLAWPILCSCPALDAEMARLNLAHHEVAPHGGRFVERQSGLDLLNHRPTPGPRQPHAVALSPSIVAEAYRWPERRPSAVPDERPPAPPREFLRIDPPDERLGRGPSRRPANHSLAAHAYRWHTALAPHAGVAATVALILSATLLYWLTLGQGPTGGAYEDILDQQNAWSSETPLISNFAADLEAADSPPPNFEFPQSPSEFHHVATADAEPQLSAAQAGGEAPVAGVHAPPAEETPDAADESAAITPTPHATPYPVTDYVSLDLALPGAVETVALEEPAAPQNAAAPPPAAPPPAAR